MATALPRAPRPRSMTLNLAPMVDVMMCLIVFFLLATKLVSYSNRPLRLPWAEQARAAPTGGAGTYIINIRPIDESGDQVEYVTTGWAGESVAEITVTPDRLADTLATAKAEAMRRGETLRVVIRADQRAQYKAIEAVLIAAGRAQVAEIAFGAQIGLDPEQTP
ncbi:MAG: biopolymer transporter ExbD [Phycisphaerales bacterium]|nr:biopolymer transporter ExbD [Phycisphaerales bacterium]